MDMASSRIFIRGLPPSLSDAEFKKHFGTQGAITDTRIFPERRIGYVGYKTSEEAEKAVKYFNKSFIRMSRIAVETARPVEEAVPFRRRGYDRQEIQPGTSSQQIAENSQNGVKRKREPEKVKAKDAKLEEYLEVMQSRSKGKKNDIGPALDSVPAQTVDTAVDVDAAASDDEYQTIEKKREAPKLEAVVSKVQTEPTQLINKPSEPEMDVDIEADEERGESQPAQQPAATDADWLRSRTSRLLGLNEEDADEVSESRGKSEHVVTRQVPTANELVAVDDTNIDDDVEDSTTLGRERDRVPDDDIEAKIRASSRIYLRNLAYTVTEDDLRDTFSHIGDLIEVHVPMDNRSGKPKGFAYLMFSNEDSAVRAWKEHDGRPFLGRLLHVLPASAKRENTLDDFALSKLPLKKQQRIKKKREATSTTFNWNSLFMNADAVMSSVADRLGVSKSELLDPTSSDAAVKQAHAETHVIQETKAYFKNHGVDLDAFKRRERGDTTILVKNFPYDAKTSEIKALFEEHGKIKQFLMPPTGTIAIVEYEQAPQARAAFSSLAYRKLRSSVLFLEKAPKELFTLVPGQPQAAMIETSQAKAAAPSAAELLQEDVSQNTAATSTLFVRNLNFVTTSERLTETFKPMAGFISARVKTKTDPKKPGQVLSMGFGFLEFKSQTQAQAALSAMNGFSLDGHKLEVRASHKAADAAEERRKEDKAKKLAGRTTKIIIKNLPFETSKNDVRALFGSYGQLRSIRVPKKFDKSARGFAFAEFTTPKEALSAMDALRDTHLLGRRLVLDFAEEDPEDAEAEIEKMQKKVGSQINKVALQKLTGSGRKKFNIGDQDGDEA